MSPRVTKLLELDARGIQLVQSVYDYALDRWSVLIGTFRVGAISACFLFVFLEQYYYAESQVQRLTTIGVWLLIVFPLVGIMLIRPHLAVDNSLQEGRRFNQLNASAVLHQDSIGFMTRVASIVLVVLLHIARGPFVIMDLLSITFLIAWLWSRAVIVRDQDPFRFRQSFLREAFTKV
jgi:hypothetical protein